MVLLYTGTPGTSREVYSEHAQWLEHSVHKQGVTSSGPMIGLKTAIFQIVVIE